MGKDIWKPGTVIYPVPAVMVSCGTMEQKNIIIVAWTGTVNSDPAMTYVSIRPSRLQYHQGNGRICHQSGYGTADVCLRFLRRAQRQRFG